MFRVYDRNHAPKDIWDINLNHHAAKGLLGAWPLMDNLRDMTGRSQPGIALGDLKTFPTPGFSTKQFYTDGTGDGVELPGSDVAGHPLDLTGPYSFCFRAKFDELAQTNVMLGKAELNGAVYQYRFVLSGGAWGVGGGDAVVQGFASDPSPTVGVWSHGVWTGDFSSSTPHKLTHFDEILGYSTQTLSSAPATNSTQSILASFGGHWNTYPAIAFVGEQHMCDFRVYKRILTDAEKRAYIFEPWGLYEQDRQNYFVPTTVRNEHKMHRYF